jgi:thioredoxin-like negative regulator of GroEL
MLLALDLMGKRPAAEDVVRKHLQGGAAEPALRMAYARALMGAQRYVDAAAQLEQVTREKPDLAPPYLSLGALQLEMRHPRRSRGRAAALPASCRRPKPRRRPGQAQAATMTTPTPPRPGPVQAWLMLAQAAEQRGDFAAAEAWLAASTTPRARAGSADPPRHADGAPGPLAEARELVRRAPERER